MRIRLDLAYDGTGFHGWARQPGLRTVQGVLEAALATVLCCDPVGLTCAGRTDAGVHARGQVAHLDVTADAARIAAGRSRSDPVDALAHRLNGVLPADVRVRRGTLAPAGFDARFSPVWRRYTYRVADAPALVDPLRRQEILVRRRGLDLGVMNRAAALLLGEHDFASFCKRREGATTIRTLHELSWSRDGSGLALAHVRADAFCHHMVRSLVGALLSVGEGRREPSWVGEVLAARRRDPAVSVVSAHGLTLEEVAYPPDHELAERARVSRAVRTLDPSTGADATGPGEGVAGRRNG